MKRLNRMIVVLFIMIAIPTGAGALLSFCMGSSVVIWVNLACLSAVSAYGCYIAHPVTYTHSSHNTRNRRNDA